MSSVKTELGETTSISDFYRELLQHTEHGRRMSSAIIELGKEQVCKKCFWENCFTLSMAVACLLQLLK